MPDSTLANLTAATAATGGLFYGTQSGIDKKFTSTAAGAALIEAADAAAQRSLLSVLPLSGGTLTGTLTGTTFVGALTGTASGNLVAGGALGTPSSGTLTSCTGLPLSTGVTGTLPIANGGTGSTTAAAARVALGVSEVIAAVAQVIQVQVQNSATNSWAGEYVDIDDGNQVCRFWFTVGGSGTAPSAPSPGRLQVVAVNNGSSASDVVAAFMTALSSQSTAFSANSSFNYFNVTNLTAGAAPGNGTSLPSDFTFSTTTPGADAISRLAETDGSQLTNVNAATIPGPSSTSLGGVYASSGSSGQFVTGVSTSGDLTYSALPTTAIAKGGTGQTTAVAAFDALAPTTTKGDIIVHNGTDNIRVAVGGTNGYVLTVDAAEASGVKWAAASGGGGSSPDIRLYTADATWTNPSPSTAKRVFVRLVGGGGGGGSGRKSATGTIRCGGGGGAAGGLVEFWALTTELGSTQSVVVGAGGTGGAAVTANTTDGNTGTVGGSTSFAGTVAIGGNGGTRGTDANGPGGTAQAGALVVGVTAQANTAGGAAGAVGGGGAAPAAITYMAPTGGGGGGGLTGSNTNTAGGAGGAIGTAAAMTVLAGGTAGTSGGGNGGTGNAGRGSGTGGGGGGSNGAGAGGAGGNGGGFGAGGGGGAAGTNSVGDSGAGGNGSQGYALVITY